MSSDANITKEIGTRFTKKIFFAVCIIKPMTPAMMNLTNRAEVNCENSCLEAIDK